MTTSVPDQRRLLALSLVPKDDESLLGFLVRLVGRVRNSDARHLASAVGLRFPGCVFDDSDFVPLSEVSGVPLERLRLMVYRPGSRHAHHRYGSAEIHREQFDLLRRRACIQCMSDAPYHRRFWDLTLAAACPEHGLRLVTVCHACSAPLRWSGQKIDACSQCCTLLTSAPVQVAPRAEVEAAEGLRALAWGAPVPWLHANLAAAHRGDLVRAAIVLGMFATRWQGQFRPEALAAAGAEKLGQVVGAGITTLRFWPASFHQLLAEHTSSRNDADGARRSFGDLYDWMRAMPDGVFKDECRSITQDFVQARPEIGLRSHRSEFLGGRGLSTGLISLDRAAARMGMSTTRVKRLARAGLVRLESEHGRGVPSAIQASTVEAFAVSRSRLLTLGQVSRLMAVSAANVRALQAGGLLPAVHAAKAAGLGRWAFDSDVVHDLLRRLEATRTSEVSGQTAGFRTALVALHRRGVSMSGMFRLVLDGDLPVASIDDGQAGLGRLRFCARRLRDICRMSERNTGHLTLQAGAEFLGVKWEVIDHLVKRGLLESQDRELTIDALNAFRKKYVKAADLARAHATSSRGLAKRLAQHDLAPVSGPHIDGGRQTYFLRADVVKYLGALR